MVISKINKEKFEELFNQGLSDYKIAKELGMNHVTVFQYRKRHGYVRPSLRESKEVKISEDNLQVLLGTLMGDGCLYKGKASRNPIYSNSHGPKQKEYSEFLASSLQNLGAKVHYSKRTKADPRTGIAYESFTCVLPASPSYNYLYEAFYKEGRKHIPIELLSKFTAKSLAFLFMDDGSKVSKGYCIHTNSFEEEEIKQFRQILLDKFNLETSMFKNRVVYIKARSAQLFRQLVEPYMCKCMKYKL